MRIEEIVEIDRPPEEVFSYVTNPENLLLDSCEPLCLVSILASFSYSPGVGQGQCRTSDDLGRASVCD